MRILSQLSLIRFVLLGVLAAVIASLCVPGAHAGTVTFTNTSGAWNAAASWSPNQIPLSSDSAVIASNTFVTTLGANETCGSLAVYGFLVADGYTFTSSGPATVYAGATLRNTNGAGNTKTKTFGSGLVVLNGGTNQAAYHTYYMGDLTINPGGTYYSIANYRLETNGVRFGGNVTNSGTWNCDQEGQQNPNTFLGAGNQFIVANNTMFFGCGMDILGNYTLQGTAFLGVANPTYAILEGTGALTNMGTLIYNSTIAPVITTLNCSAVNNTFDWLNNGIAGNKTPMPINYYNLILGDTSSSGAWNLGAPGFSVSGTLTINGARGVTNWPSAGMTNYGLLWNPSISGSPITTNPVALTMSGNYTLGGVGSPLALSGVISDGGNGYSLTKAGKSQISLMPSTPETYSGDTIVNGGTLVLDFSQFAGNQNNLVSSSSALIFGNNYAGGGTLAVSGKAGATDSQTFNGLVLAAGDNTVSNNVVGTATTVNLGGITRGAGGGTVNFVSTRSPATGAIKTTTANNAAGILGGWALVNGADWAANDGSGNIVACSGYVPYDGASGSNPAVNYLASDGTAQGNFTGNSLRVAAGFNITGGSITLGGGNAGGLLCTSTAVIGNNDGGNYTLGAGPGNEFLVNIAAGQTLTLSGVSLIGNNNGGLTKAGPGTLSIASAAPSTPSNLSYTGPTTINGGTLSLAPSVSFASPALTVDAGATLSLGAPLTLCSNATLSGSGTISGAMLTMTNGTLYPGGNTSYGTLTVANGLTLSSNVTVVFDLDNPVSANNDLLVATNGFNVTNATLVINPGPRFMTGTYTLVTGGKIPVTGSFNTNIVFANNNSGMSYSATVSTTPVPAAIPGDPYTATRYLVPSNNIVLTVLSYTPCTMPTIALGANPSVPFGSTSADLSYGATTSSPNSYSILWSAAARSAGFVNVTNAPLTASPIVLAVPTTAAGTTYSGTLTVQNASGCSSVGSPFSVTVIPPAIGSLIFTQQPPPVALVGTVVSPAPAVKVLDGAGDPMTGVVVTLTLSNLTTHASSSLGSSPSSDANGVATFRGVILNAPVGTYELMASVGQVSAFSGPFSLTTGPAASLLVTLPGQTFTSGSGNSGSAAALIAGVPFGLTLTAVDSSGNVDTTYSGARTVSYSGPGGSPTYTTSVTFSGGQATAVVTVLTRAETTTITASISGLTGVASSSVTVGTWTRALTPLDNFSGGSDGALLYAGLTLSGNTLYGTANIGGSSGNGTVFSVHTDGTGFANLHNFTGGNDGANPNAGLVLSGNTLYGTTYGGGTSANGTIFAVRTDGTGFTNLHSFTALDQAYYTQTNTDGANPYAGLILSGKTLYGTTYSGGNSGDGTVFAVHTDGTGFTTLHSFNYGVDGANPSAGLVLSGNTLYGTAPNGASAGAGAVFAVQTDGTGFTNLYTFTAYDQTYYTNRDGANPFAGLMLSGNTLYGTAEDGGLSDAGTVFTVHTDGTGFTNLHNFTAYDLVGYSNGDGANPYAGLVLSDNILYGTAYGGGSAGNGAVFALHTDGTGFTNLHSFAAFDSTYYTNNDGAHPYAGLLLLGNTLYGAAYGGGNLDGGTVFSLPSLLAGPMLTVATASMPDGMTGVAYNQALAASGGLTPYGWTSSSGTLPPGLSLGANGVISGIPITSGTFTFDASVTDGFFITTTQTLSLTIRPWPQLTLISSGTNIVLMWPTNVAGFGLQSAVSLVAPVAWTTTPSGPLVVNGQNAVTNPVSDTKKFYRLILNQ